MQATPHQYSTTTAAETPLPGEPSWSRLQAAGAVSLIKHGPHRSVYRVDQGTNSYYVKQFRQQGWIAKIKSLFRENPAHREWQAAVEIQNAGLPTFQLLRCLTRTLPPGESLLATQAIPSAISVAELVPQFWPAQNPTRFVAERQQLAVELGRIVGQLHRHGLNHPDLHAGNVLVQMPGSARSAAMSQLDCDWPVLSLIDLHAVTKSSRLGWQQKLQNLGCLQHFFIHRCSLSDRFRFWRAYAELALRDELAGSNAAELFRRVGHALRLQADFSLQRADRAWVRGNRHTLRKTTAAGRSRAVATLSQSTVDAFLSAPEAPFAASGSQLIKTSARHTVARVAIDTASGPISAYWKGQTYGSGWRQWFGKWIWTAVRRSWEMGHALRRQGIRTPMPLLMFDAVATANQPARGYLLTAAVRNGTPLQDWLPSIELQCAVRKSTTKSAAAAERSSMLRHLAAVLATLHSSGFEHRDLKLANVLVGDQRSRGEPANAVGGSAGATGVDPVGDDFPVAVLCRRSRHEPVVWLIDLDGVRRWKRSVPSHRRIQNLSRLFVSARANRVISSSDALRFLKQYLQFARELAIRASDASFSAFADRRKIVASVLNSANRKQRRNEINGRRLD